MRKYAGTSGFTTISPLLFELSYYSASSKSRRLSIILNANRRNGEREESLKIHAMKDSSPAGSE